MPSAIPEPGGSLADLRPEVAAEWHPHKNGELTAFDVKPASAKSVWWCCIEGHEWVTKPQNRLRGERCPTCSASQSAIKRATPSPDRSLFDLYPAVAAEWHPRRNGAVTSRDVNPGSKTKRWWRCGVCGFDWETDPDHRTRSKRGCPKCGRKRISESRSAPKPGRSFGDVNPHLVDEWHPERNGTLTPFDCAPRSRRKVWWRCRFGHEWQALIAPRTIGVGCPSCTTVGVSERQIRLAYELQAAGLKVDHTRAPITVMGRRPVRADIVVPQWRLVIEYDGAHFHHGNEMADRAQSAALAAAGWRVLRVRENPLSSLGGHEIFVRASLSLKQLTSVVIDAVVALGIDVPGAPDYRSDPECWAKAAADSAVYRHRATSVASELPAIARQWHPTRNGTVTAHQIHPGSSTAHWWLCETCGHEWKAAPATRAAGIGCSVCGHRRAGVARSKPLPGRSLADVRPVLVDEWHPILNDGLQPADIRPFSSRRVWWRCSTCSNEWQAAVSTRSSGHGCARCSYARQGQHTIHPDPGQSFADLYPVAVQEWHPLRNPTLSPSQFKAFSMKRVWWQCKSGHEWQTTFATRARGSGCPLCASAARGAARSTPAAGASLADTFPTIARDWHPSKNRGLSAFEVKPGSSKHRLVEVCNLRARMASNSEVALRRWTGMPTLRPETSRCGSGAARAGPLTRRHPSRYRGPMASHAQRFSTAGDN